VAAFYCSAGIIESRFSRYRIKKSNKKPVPLGRVPVKKI